MRAFAPLFLLLVVATPAAPAPGEGRVSPIDLSRPFGTRSTWQFTAAQEADIPDPLGLGEDKAPGAMRLCVSQDAGRTCQPDLENLLALSTGRDLYAEPHFLNDARIVQPSPDRKLFLLQVASLHGGNGDQRVATAVLAYDRAKDIFVPIYKKQTGRNNNQEVRYVADGSLQGAMISAEPTNDAPFAFWMTVNRLAGDSYKQALKYRSATRYGDGNPLAVIDSEMPNIEQRLGIWHSRSKLPLPHGPCRNPHLVRGELWC